MGRVISLLEEFGEDAEQMKQALILFSSIDKNTGESLRDAQIISVTRTSGQELASAGAMEAEKHANEFAHNWSEKAMAALCGFIREHKGKFQAEDVRRWAVNVPPAPSLRAWGSIILRASRSGLIKHAGYARVSNPLAHATPAALWEPA